MGEVGGSSPAKPIIFNYLRQTIKPLDLRDINNQEDFIIFYICIMTLENNWELSGNSEKFLSVNIIV